jgi:peroxiredoxin
MLSSFALATLFCATTILIAQETSSPLATAKALDQEISALKNLPEAERAAAIKSLANRIRQQPSSFAVSLAANLAVDGVDGSADDTILDIANTLAEALSKSPRKPNDSAYVALAELVRYNNLPLTFEDPNFKAAMNQLALKDKYRANLDLDLFDLQGRRWQLKQLKGKVVLINFWATWCPPCRAELPELRELQQRFGTKGLVILAVSDEDTTTLSNFVKQHNVDYNVLIDPAGKLKERFQVNGIPQTFVYDRRGKLVAHAPARPSLDRFLKMLQRAKL